MTSGEFSGYRDGTATAWQGRDGRYHATAGENSRVAKLTEADVLSILARPDVSRRALAEEFGVGRDQITRIRRGEAWSHLPRPETTS